MMACQWHSILPLASRACLLESQEEKAWHGPQQCAEIGTQNLEETRLSDLTGNGKYAKLAKKLRIV
jgi:hypothetical protein